MNEPLARFLISLAGDVQRLDQFNRGNYDRDSFFQAAGLSVDDQDAILSRDPDRIYDALERPHGDSFEIHVAKKPAAMKKPAVKSPGVKKPPKSPRAPAAMKKKR